MRHIEQYLSLIIRTIHRSVAVNDKVTYIVDSPLAGTLDGILYFQHGSRVEFTEQVALQTRRLLKQLYRYQHIQKRRPIFRYDNALHYPHLPTFPHHKRVWSAGATLPLLSGEAVLRPLLRPKPGFGQ